ncbi:MAG: AAA family ATPase [Candidatus Buchananbacteria bacterium]|nr:AAA family ATPase [Candidatus Buchananbacteria bacterium]
MKQRDALNILKLGYNVFLTGAAGSGKTFLLNKYIKYLRKNDIAVAITASTGIAATHMNGRTIHSWCGMGINLKMNKSQINEIVNKDYIYDNILNTKVLIIDEVSMLHSSQLDLVDKICKTIKNNDEPFGGIQVILCGDFFQLPPVSKESDTSEYAFESDIWNNMDLKVCYLTEQYRQNDKDFLGILKKIRENSVDQDVKNKLIKRINAKAKSKLHITKLYSHNIDVDRINHNELKKIKGKEIVYEMHSEGIRTMVDSLKKSCLAPERLTIKKGAIIMFVKNNFREGYVNGTLGEIIDFDEDTNYPIVKTISDDIIHVVPATWCVEENNKILAEITQLPIRLAWAITIHKSQGISLDFAEIDLSKSFLCGMGYVALSRVKSLSGLLLKGINDMALKVDDDLLQVDKDLIKRSILDLKAFKALSKKTLKQKQNKFIEDNAEPEEEIEVDDDDNYEVRLEDIPF